MSITFSFNIYLENSGIPTEFEMDVPAVVKSGRTYVPLRFISEAFELNVSYTGDKGYHEISID